jgi:hypothetical protein
MVRPWRLADKYLGIDAAESVGDPFISDRAVAVCYL